MSEGDDFKPEFGFPIGGWFKVFAFLPIFTIDQGWKWFVPVYKRRIQKYNYLTGGADFWWQYISRGAKE